MGRENHSKSSWRYKLSGSIWHQSAPPKPAKPGAPLHRRLRVYSQDPSLGKKDGAICTLAIPFEPLKPGPTGRVFLVQDVDRDQSQEHTEVQPLDLEQPFLLMSDGLSPSTFDRGFTCQMVYAVAMETYAKFTRALGRDPGFGLLEGDGRLRLIPRGVKEANAWYDREAGEVVFGWQEAKAFAQGHSQPGSRVYIGLSRDVIAHEISHALIDGLRPNFMRPTHPDVAALHEGIADLVAVFLHFNHQAIVQAAIEETQGQVTSEALVHIGRQFGFDLEKGHAPLRTALHGKADLNKPVPKKHCYDAHKDEHELGAVLVSAVFEAYRRVYDRRIANLRRVFALYQGRLPSEAVKLLAREASHLADQFLNILIRAIDYCPTHHCTFGEFLRALITADFDLVPDDPYGYRDALIVAFRRHGIVVPEVPDLSEQSLRWGAPLQALQLDALRFSNLALECKGGELSWSSHPAPRRHAAEALAQAICSDKYGDNFGLAKPTTLIQEPTLMSLRTLRRVGPDGSVDFGLVAEVVQKRRVKEGWFLGGSTMVLDAEGRVLYAIAKNINSEKRITEQRRWLRAIARENPEWVDAAWAERSMVSARLQRGIHREKSS